MNTIGNMIYVNQNQTTTSTHIANKIATDDMQSTLQAQLSQESKELKDQDVVEVEVQNDISDYLKEQKHRQNGQNQKKNDKQNKSKLNDNNDFSLDKNDIDLQKTTNINTPMSSGIFSNFSTNKQAKLEEYEPLDIKV